jgi:hypothetical protein
VYALAVLTQAVLVLNWKEPTIYRGRINNMLGYYLREEQELPNIYERLTDKAGFYVYELVTGKVGKLRDGEGQ